MAPLKTKYFDLSFDHACLLYTPHITDHDSYQEIKGQLWKPLLGSQFNIHLDFNRMHDA